jgi:hypothetical protein
MRVKPAYRFHLFFITDMPVSLNPQLMIILLLFFGINTGRLCFTLKKVKLFLQGKMHKQIKG